MAPPDRFVDALNTQITNEFAASQQYVAIAIYYESHTLPQLSQFFYHQAVEERNHAMMMCQYLLDTSAAVRLEGIAAPKTDFDGFIEPIRLALEQEQSVSGQISNVFSLAREEQDYLSEQFMQWFLKEQVEEVALITTLVRVSERAGADLFHLEDFVAREIGAAGADATAPKAAGGSL